MEATYIYPNGRRVEALVLQAGPLTMRLIARDVDDAIILRLIDGRWTDDSGETVEFESLLMPGTVRSAGFYPEIYPLTIAANSAAPV